MNLLDLGHASRHWPWIRFIGNTLIKFPENPLSLEPLGELQEDLSREQFREEVNEMLHVLHSRTAEIVETLREQKEAEVTEELLRAAAEDLAGQLYLERLADKFYHADFKGIEQQSRFVSLPLDDIFIDLRAAPEQREGTRREKESELLARFEQAGERERNRILQTLEELDTEGDEAKPASEARPLDELLANPGPAVLLGGPGSGKTTLVKRLALSCALGPYVLERRCPKLPWCFPVVMPVARYVTEAPNQPLLAFIEEDLRRWGGEALAARYRHYLNAGRVLLLLDGLDEIVATNHRIAAARAVDEAIGALGSNRLLLTSRRVGYAICRLARPAPHFLLAPLSPQDITAFVTQWTLAYDRVAHREKADPTGARKAADALNAELAGNSSAAALAANPLMLTIIALVKQESTVLPSRRVELYEIALNTLLRSWNLARSLAARPAGEEPCIEQTRAIWSHIAFWMHTEANRDINREKLQSKLVEVLTNHYDKDEFAAKEIAESYLDAATETRGLLEARSPSQPRDLAGFRTFAAVGVLARDHGSLFGRGAGGMSFHQ